MVPGFPSAGTRQAAAMIPYENFKGAVLGNQYQLQYFKVQDGHLGIYVVTNLRPRGSGGKQRASPGQKPEPGYADDEVLEAKAFPLSCACALGQGSQARRRRIKRICRSQNFRDEVEQSGMRFLISHVKRSEAEWRALCRPAPPAKPMERVEPASCARKDSFSDMSSLGCHLDNGNDTPSPETESKAGGSSSGDLPSRPTSRASTVSSASRSASTPPASPTLSWAKIAALSTATSEPAIIRQRGVEIVINHHPQHEPRPVPEPSSPLSYAQALADGLPKRTSTKHGLRQARCRQRWREERRQQVAQGGPSQPQKRT